MRCPNCNSPLVESYDARTGENRVFECEECGYSATAFDAYAATEGYPMDKDDFEDWRSERGI